MHVVNRVLGLFGLRVSKADDGNMMLDRRRHSAQIEVCKCNTRGFAFSENIVCHSGGHPFSYIDAECAFAAECIRKANPDGILDIGSYRQFVLGLLSKHSADEYNIDVFAETG